MPMNFDEILTNCFVVAQKNSEENNLKIQGIMIRKLRHLICMDLVLVSKLIAAKAALKQCTDSA